MKWGLCVSDKTTAIEAVEECLSVVKRQLAGEAPDLTIVFFLAWAARLLSVRTPRSRHAAFSFKSGSNTLRRVLLQRRDRACGWDHLCSRLYQLLWHIQASILTRQHRRVSLIDNARHMCMSSQCAAKRVVAYRR